MKNDLFTDALCTALFAIRTPAMEKLEAMGAALEKEREASSVNEGPRKNSMSAGTRARRKRSLLLRDGTSCWLCGKHMPESDRTFEHLVELCKGGSNDLTNLVLAHSACNGRVNGMTIDEKRALRRELRGF